MKGVECLPGLKGAMQDVVEELRADGGPDVEGGIVGLDDGSEEVGGEGGVEPGDDADIDLGPLGVTKHGGGED